MGGVEIAKVDKVETLTVRGNRSGAAPVAPRKFPMFALTSAVCGFLTNANAARRDPSTSLRTGMRKPNLLSIEMLVDRKASADRRGEVQALGNHLRRWVDRGRIGLAMVKGLSRPHPIAECAHCSSPREVTND